MSQVRHRMPLMRALRTCAVIAATVTFGAAPVTTLAAPSYTVDSNLDFPKSGASGPACQSTAPGNPCTLRAAIETANQEGPGATIDVPGALGTIALDQSNGVLAIQEGMTIRSTGAGSPRIDGGNAMAALTNVSGAAVTLSGLTLQNSSGGALLNVGQQLTINGLTITGNQTNHAVFSSGVLVSNGSTVTGNADGGMLLAGATTLNNTNVTRNQHNGGVFSTNASLTVNGGSISDNVESAGDGGGLVAFGQLTVTGATLARNLAGGAGGGIDVVGAATLTGVKVTDNTATAGAGGILVDGTTGSASATIVSSTLSGNSSQGDGGGMGIVTAALTLTGSTLNGNRSEQGAGGGIAALSSTTSLVNDTLTGNVAPRLSGGGIVQESLGHAPTRAPARAWNPAAVLEHESQAVRAMLARHRLPTTTVPQTMTRGAAAPKAMPDDLTMVSVTLAGNSAAAGGGISNGQGLLFTVHDSIVGSNLATAGPSDCLGSFTSAGYNLESAADCAFAAAGDRQRRNPQLQPLAANGGPTSTMALNPGSPAIDAGDPSCPPPGTDQRGVNRPQGARCDIGAFEAVGTVPLPAPPVTGHPRDGEADWLRVLVTAGLVAIMVLISLAVEVQS